MYSGILQLPNDELANEIIAATDYFQMTALKEALDRKFRYHVYPCDVFHWAKIADMFNLPKLTSICDRIQLVKFKEVVKHKEFCELPKDEVLKYITKCKEYSGIYNDDLLTAALKWVDNNEPFPELMQQIDLEKCSQGTLKAAAKHPAMPQNIIAQLENFDNGKRETQPTLVYVMIEEGIMVDNGAQLRSLHKYEIDHEQECDLDPHRVCYTDNGYVFIKEVDDNNLPAGQVRTTINKYNAITGESIELPGAGKRKPFFRIFNHL